MAEFVITGAPTKCSLTDVKHLLRAADMLLRQMGFHPVYKEVGVRLIPNYACRAFKLGIMKINSRQNFSDMASSIIHELLHIYINEWDTDDEWKVSTLTARLKADVVELANYLTVRRQKYAAYKAHCKLSYAVPNQDEYNDEQHHNKHAPSKAKPKRKGVIK